MEINNLGIPKDLMDKNKFNLSSVLFINSSHANIKTLTLLRKKFVDILEETNKKQKIKKANKLIDLIDFRIAELKLLELIGVQDEEKDSTG